MLADTDSGTTRAQCIALRVLAARGPAPHPPRSTTTSPASRGSASIYPADLDPDDLATAHRVLAEVTERAKRLRDEP